MNKNLTFLTAPITALFMPQVHRDAIKDKASRGILYMLYLALVGTVLFLALYFFLALPQVDKFTKWIGGNLPTMIWTQEGLALSNPGLPQPIRLEHPKYGLIATIDMDKTDVTADDFEQSAIYVTSRSVFLKRGPQNIQKFSVLRPQDGSPVVTSQGIQQMPSKIKITGNTAEAFLGNILNVLVPLMTILIFIVVFFAALFSNLLYSLIGLLLNLMRKSKLKYGAIFNLTCFATTVGFTVTCLKSVFPFIPFSLLLITILNLIYMVVMFKITDSEAKV